MSNKPKNVTATAKVIDIKRQSSYNSASSSRPKTVIPQIEKKVSPPSKNKTSYVGSADTSIYKQESISQPDFDAEYREIAYGSFLRAMLEECLVDEKIEREENQDTQIAQLADRFQNTMVKLDKTNQRLKDVSFVVEQKRLLDMKNKDCSTFYETTDNLNAQDILQNLSNTEQVFLDKLNTKNIDFGYNKDTGHKELLDAVNDATEGLEQIKKHSNLDMHKFREYEKTQNSLDQLEKDRSDLEGLKIDFETKFPKFSESLLMEASDKIAKMMNND